MWREGASFRTSARGRGFAPQEKVSVRSAVASTRSAHAVETNGSEGVTRCAGDKSANVRNQLLQGVNLRELNAEIGHKRPTQSTVGRRELFWMPYLMERRTHDALDATIAARRFGLPPRATHARI